MWRLSHQATREVPIFSSFFLSIGRVVTVPGFTPGSSRDWFCDSRALAWTHVSVMARVTCTAVVDKVLSAHGHWVLTGVVYQVRGAPWFPCKNGFLEERRLLHEEYAEHLKLLVFAIHLDAQLLGALNLCAQGWGGVARRQKWGCCSHMLHR